MSLSLDGFLTKWEEQDRRTNRLRAGVLEQHPLRGAGLDAIPTDPAIVWGMDWSGYWNGVPNLAVAKQRGCRFCIIKAVDGTVPTIHFAENVANAKAQGLIVGAYFWLYPNSLVSGGGQARAWWQAVKDLDLDLYCVDYEWTYWGGKPANPNQSDLLGALPVFEDLAGEGMTIYSAPGYLGSYPLPLMGDHALWLANYGVIRPALVSPWGSNYMLWQCAETWDALQLGFDPGICHAADGDLFNGSVAQFESIFGGSTPDNGDVTVTTYTGTVNATLGVNVRRDDGTKIGSLPNGTAITGDDIEMRGTVAPWSGYQWMHLTTPMVGWVAVQFLTYSTVTDPVDVPVTITGATVHLSDGTDVEMRPV